MKFRVSECIGEAVLATYPYLQSSLGWISARRELDVDWRPTIRSGKDFENNKCQAPGLAGKAELKLFVSISLVFPSTSTSP